MAYLPGYCDIAFADDINLSDEWQYSEDEQKDFALTMARLYIDKNYSCSDDLWDTSDYTTIPEEVQRANAVLAEKYIKGLLINTETPISGPITSKKVKAGSVETTTTYLGGYSNTPKKIDQNEEVTIMISAYCTWGSSKKDLIRV